LVTNFSYEKGIWTDIAECLPNRSIMSIYCIAKKRFNTNNYKGRWSELETEKLIELTKTEGNKWRKIGDMLGRTGTNVKDKWKEIG